MGWTFYNTSGEALINDGGMGSSAEATQAQMEAETSGVIFVPPDLMKNSPGVPKAWCNTTDAGAIGSPDYGVSAVTDSATGVRSINFSTNFSSTTYAATGAMITRSDRGITHFDTIAVGSIRLVIGDLDADGELDLASSVIFYGDH